MNTDDRTVEDDINSGDDVQDNKHQEASLSKAGSGGGGRGGRVGHGPPNFYQF